MTSNICVVGCGNWGRNLVRTFSTLRQIRGICDPDVETARRASASCPEAIRFENYTAVLESPDIDAVVLATPAERHFDMALDAIYAGKDVLVEKPLALEACDGAELIEAARRTGRILMVGHLLHYHPGILKLKELIHAGVLGRIEYIYSNRLSMGRIRREENALWSFAPHDISVILSMIGHAPLQVTATGGAYLQPNIADVTVSNLLFDRGVRAHIFVSWLHPYKEQRLVVIGSRQMAVFEDSRPDRKLMLFNKHIELRNGSFETQTPEGVAIPFDPAEPLLRECAHFVDCIQSRSTPITPGEEGLRVLNVLEACQRSLQLNGEPVQVGSGLREKVMAM